MKTLHQSKQYAAYHLPVEGLIVQSTRKAGGVRLTPDHPQYENYVDAFETAIDSFEGDALCRALLN